MLLRSFVRLIGVVALAVPLSVSICVAGESEKAVKLADDITGLIGLLTFVSMRSRLGFQKMMIHLSVSLRSIFLRVLFGKSLIRLTYCSMRTR